MTLGNRIRRARNRRGITQVQLGEKLGVSGAAVSGWERDEDEPEYKNLRRLPKLLKVPAEWLLNGSGDPPDPDEPAFLLESLPAAMRPHAIRLLKAMAEDTGEAA